MEKRSLLETLNTAVEMEEKGHRFYQEMSQKSKNDITRKTFSFLADNEILHIETIKDFHRSLQEGGKLPKLEITGVDDKRAKDLSIFSKSIKELNEKINPSDDDKKACEFAMEFENNGYRYYKDMSKDAEDPNLKRLLDFLLKEESKHYEAIEDLHTYLADSHNWFMYEEGSFPQGG